MMILIIQPPSIMLQKVIATRFDRAMGNGQTKPTMVECEDDAENSVLVVVKSSGGCMLKEKSLAYEAMTAMLAADLDLPVPEPFIVELTHAFIDSMEENESKQIYRKSCQYAFGSKYMPPGFSIWPTGTMVPEHLITEAAEIFVFDAIIVNSDRRPTNPNCLFSGTELAIFDHELVFGFDTVLFWKGPWEDGEIDKLNDRKQHIFAGPYFATVPPDLDRFVEAWGKITDSRFDEYRAAIPPEWSGDGVFVDEVIKYLKVVRTNIQVIVSNALKVLK